MKYFSRLNISYVRRMTLTYSIFAAVLIGITGAYFYSKADETMINEIAMASKFRLDKVQDFTEKSLIQRYEQTYSEKVLSTVDKSSLSSDFLYFLNNPWKGNSYRLVQLVEELHKSKRSNTEMEDVTIYYVKDNFLVNSDTFLSQPFSYADQPFIAQLPSVPKHEWFKRTSATGKELLTFVYTLPYMSTGDKIKGYMFIDLTMESLRKLYSDMMNSSKEKLYVFDHSGELLFSTLPGDSNDIAKIDKVKTSGSEFKLINNENGKEVISYLSSGSSATGWSYASVLPLNSMSLFAKNLKADIIWSCLYVLIFGFIASYFLSRRFYLPLKRLLYNIRNVYGVPDPYLRTNEFTRIDHVINHMDRKIVNLEDKLKTKQLLNLLYGHFSDGDGKTQLPHNSHYAVALLKTEPDQANSVLSQFIRTNHAYAYESILLQSDEFAVIYFIDNKDRGALIVREDIDQFRTVISREFSFGAAIGSIVDFLEEIHLSYRQAKQTAAYSFLYGTHYLLNHEEVSMRKRSTSLFAFEPFENALKAADITEWEPLIHQFEKQVMNESIHLEAIELALNNIVGVISKVTIELNLQERLKSTSDLFAEYKKSNLHETIAWIKTICHEISLDISLHMKDMHHSLIHELKHYIDHHLHEDISLDCLSQRASLSSPYVSTLFREVMGIPFSEYLTQERLLKAADLLIHEAQSVKEISAIVGYRNVPYFCTKFKEKYGVTPIQFRNSNQRRRSAIQESEPLPNQLGE